MLHQTTEMHLLFCSLGFSFHLPPPKRLLAASFWLAFIFKGPSGLASPSLCPKLLRNCCYSALLSHFYFSRLHYNNFVPENLIVILNIYCMLHVNKCQVDSWNVTSFCKNFSLLSFLCLDLHRCCDETFYISSSDLKKSRWKALKITSFFMLALSSLVLQLDSVWCTTQTDSIIVHSYLCNCQLCELLKLSKNCPFWCEFATRIRVYQYK